MDSESSQSSSGYEDGLGRRILAFDRETGEMLERLVLRPELSAFEAALRERLTIVAGLEDERFTRPRGIEKDADDRLTIVSEYVAGRRLSDLLEAAAEHGIVAGLDAGLGLLLELLPSLARLHDAGLAHGSLAPGRVMMTPAGQVVLLDSIYADPLERLKLTRRRLWTEFRLAFPSSAGIARFDKAADLGHAAMVAAALSVGRPLRDDDHPDGIAALRQEILEIASIRGSKGFAESVDRFFGGALPLTGKRAPSPVSADEAAIDLRKLVRRELGITTCRTALLEFFQQVETADAERLTVETARQAEHIQPDTERLAARQAAEAARLEVERLESERVARERADTERAGRERAEAERQERERAEQARLETERLEHERVEQARLEAERLERERIEQARVEAEWQERERAEQARLEAEWQERERVEQARLETERQERERAEQARLEAEWQERERVEQARLEAERVERERVEQARLEAERQERERVERARLEAERLEKERIEKARLEAERVERERVEKARLEAIRVERERVEKARLEAERLERERVEKARLEAERLERERVEKARLEAERLERERVEKARLEAERLERERVEKARLEAERLERERLEAERLERERLEAERLEAERLEKERAEQARLEAERLERERLEAERREQERLEAERLERERVEKARLEAERLERERLEAERIARERAKAARLEAERLERERLEAERLEGERLERERIEKARLEAERRERERAEKARIEAERLEQERLEKARLEAERLERERVENERRERVARERAEKARIEAERAEKARLEAERLAIERADAERREQELLDAARAERERAEKARLDAERLEHERLEHARLEAERMEEEEARERAEQARIEQERLAAEEQAREREAEAARARAREEELVHERLELARLEAERLEEEKARARAEQARIEEERLAAEERARQRDAEAARARAREAEERAREAEEEAERAASVPAASWLIPPDQAAKFQHIVPDAPSGPGGRVYPIYVPPAEPAAWMSDLPASTPVMPELEPVASDSHAYPSKPGSIGAPSGSGTIRLKEDLYSMSIAAHSRAEGRQEPEDVSAIGAYGPFEGREAGRSIPWKLVAGGVVLIGTTFAITRGLTPAAAPIIETVRKVAPAPVPAPPPPPPVPSNAGRLTITTQPAGARVVIDGKPAGETPLTLDTVRPGRHVITLTAPSGASAKRTVRVDAGQTVAVDLPLFSGFATISAPFVMDVSENGKALGTSENQILLSPGTHSLRLSNKDLGYVATESVEVQPGEVTHLTLDPRGRANINAAPWAEVWIDGEKAGDTPLANVAIRLGIREIVFKNPQFGERKVTATVTGTAPATISVNFNK